MAQKSIIRSMRFSNKIIEMIETQAGKNFTAKFEALVTKCVWELPRKEEELRSIQQTIDQERKRLQSIKDKTLEIENHAYRLNSLITGYCNNVQYTVKSIEDKLERNTEQS